MKYVFQIFPTFAHQSVKLRYAMKARIGVLMIILGLIAGSCNKGKTFSQYKKEEREAINNLIAKENFEIINQYPTSGVFGEKQFVLLDNGCYLNVVDSGNGNRAVAGVTSMWLIRAMATGLLPDKPKY